MFLNSFSPCPAHFGQTNPVMPKLRNPARSIFDPGKAPFAGGDSLNHRRLTAAPPFGIPDRDWPLPDPPLSCGPRPWSSLHSCPLMQWPQERSNPPVIRTPLIAARTYPFIGAG